MQKSIYIYSQIKKKFFSFFSIIRCYCSLFCSGRNYIMEKIFDKMTKKRNLSSNQEEPIKTTYNKNDYGVTVLIKSKFIF